MWPGSPAIPHLQTRVAFLPYGPKRLKTLKPVPWKREPSTLGEHLLKRRMELGLRQRDLRRRFKLEKETYANWEKDRCTPAMKHWPNISAFLGYDPSPEPTTLGQRFLAYRRRHGLSRKALATSLGVDEATLWHWETDERAPTTKAHLHALRLFATL